MTNHHIKKLIKLKNNRLFLGLLISAAVFVYSQIFLPTNDTKEILQPQSNGKISALSSKIKKIGAKSALQELKDDIRDVKRNSEQHARLHEFGEALYETEGFKGIVFCDESYAYGCYHSFFSRVVSENGPETVEVLAQECIKKYGENGRNCIHGIGHAILQFYGPRSFIKAVKICDGLDLAERLNGCYGGVFMEYYRPVLVVGDSIVFSEKEADKNNLYAPCFEVDGIARASCLFHQAQWLYVSILKSAVEVENHCMALVNSGLESACLKGMGAAITAHYGGNTTASMSECEKMRTDANFRDCVFGLVLELFSIDKYRYLTPKVCLKLESKLKQACSASMDEAISYVSQSQSKD